MGRPNRQAERRGEILEAGAEYGTFRLQSPARNTAMTLPVIE